MKPAAPGKPTPNRDGRQTMTFHKSRNMPPPSREQVHRQNDVLQSAWRHFGQPGLVIAFLNTRHEQLDGQPLHLAVESAEGLMRVERLLEEMTSEPSFQGIASMWSDTPPSPKPFTIFRTAAEEAAMKVEEEKWHDEGGPMKSRANLVTHVPGADLPYRVILARPRGGALERFFATMQEAEAFIRRHGPVPTPGLSTLYDRPAS